MQQGLPDRQSRRRCVEPVETDAMIVAGETRGTHNPEGDVLTVRLSLTLSKQMAGCCKGCHPFGVGNKPLPKLESVHPFGVGENYSIFYFLRN